jgi:hypothetical protein
MFIFQYVKRKTISFFLAIELDQLLIKFRLKTILYNKPKKIQVYIK